MFKCAMYVTHQEWANGKLMKEEPEEIIMSQQPTNILFLYLLGGLKKFFHSLLWGQMTQSFCNVQLSAKNGHYQLVCHPLKRECAKWLTLSSDGVCVSC